MSPPPPLNPTVLLRIAQRPLRASIPKNLSIGVLSDPAFIYSVPKVSSLSVQNDNRGQGLGDKPYELPPALWDVRETDMATSISHKTANLSVNYRIPMTNCISLNTHISILMSISVSFCHFGVFTPVA